MPTPSQISVLHADISTLRVDAIVNAANSSLMGGGGVDGAIHAAGGPTILEQCRRIVELKGRCPAGEAVITTAGVLDAKYVIHTVGPFWHGGAQNEAQTLSNCYRNSLQLAVDHGCTSIAFPCISSGVYGYPLVEAALVALRAVSSFLRTPSTIERVLMVCFDLENFDAMMECQTRL